MSTPGNAINEATTGVCGFSGTAFTSSPATQHCVQVGGANSHLLANVTNGTTGQFLGANTGAAPTFQTPPSAGNLTTDTIIYDDFLTQIGSPLQFAGFGSGAGTTSVNPSTDAAHPGILTHPSFASGTTGVSMLGPASATARHFKLGAGIITVNWIIKLATLSDGTNTYTLYCGLQSAITAPASGVYFTYTHGTNSGNYVINCSAASVTTSANTSTAASTNWVNLGIIINAAGTSASFYVNGTEVANSPIASNLPTTALGPMVGLVRSAGTIPADTLLIDAVYLKETFTTPR